MAVFHRSYDISPQPIFEKPIEMQALRSDSPWMRPFEYGAGLDHGEFRAEANCVENYLLVQPRLRQWLQCSFVPVDSVLKEIYSMFEHNFTHPQHARIRFHLLQSLVDTPFTFEVSGYRKPLFTRHPVTGRITKHTYPYPKLPLFKTTAHPCLTIFRALSLYSIFADESQPLEPRPLLTDIRKCIGRGRSSIPESYYRPVVSPSNSVCPSLVYSTGTSSDEEEEEPQLGLKITRAREVGLNESSMVVDVGADVISKPVVVASYHELDSGEWTGDVADRIRPKPGVGVVPAQPSLCKRPVRPSRLPRPVRTTRRTRRS